MDLKDRAAYLKGLFEGMKLDKSAEETKIFEVVVDLIGNIASEVEKLKVDCCENKELIYELDEDLGEVERLVCDCDNAKGQCREHEAGSGHGDCVGCNHIGCDGSVGGGGDYSVNDEYVNDEEDGDDDGDDEKYEVLCPYCKHIICLEDDSFSEATVVCPSCKRELEFDYGDEDNQSSESTEI